jgi:hypothetical protein
MVHRSAAHHAHRYALSVPPTEVRPAIALHHAMPTLLEYRRTTREQAAIDFGKLGGMISGGIAFLLGAIFLFHVESRYIWIGVGVFALVCLAILGLVIAYRRANGTFVCRLDETSLHCVSPMRHFGQTFDIAIADIARVEVSSMDDSALWYVVHRDGRRFWLSGNFGNPAHEFAAKVCELTGVPRVEVP